MILMIDNYDSFTYNIVHYLLDLGGNVTVKRNDAITIKEIKSIHPSHIMISPGPRNPNYAGISLSIIKEIMEIPILGICLGHQCIGQFFGGKIVLSKKIYHGRASDIIHHQQGVFKNLISPFKAIRYHSLVIEKESFPNKELLITAYSEDNEIMGIKHITRPIEGIQFHPESIGSEYGHDLLKNFLDNY
jgi:anthranilate synthase component 2